MMGSDLAGADWRKSSRSGSQGGDCVEIATANWRKSSRSGTQGGDCVEVAAHARMVAMRDSKDPVGPVLCLSSSGWVSLLDAIKSGRH